MTFCKAIVLAAAVLTAPAAWAINKCTMPDGRVVYQDASCSNDAKDKQAVKTWTEGAAQQSGGRHQGKSVEPNLKLQGPPEAKGLIELYRRWADTDRLARTTGRIALAGPVASLQAMQREAESVTVPECLSMAHKALTSLITRSTEAILQFMGNQEATNIIYEFVDKPRLVPEFEHAVSTAYCGNR